MTEFTPITMEHAKSRMREAYANGKLLAQNTANYGREEYFYLSQKNDGVGCAVGVCFDRDTMPVRFLAKDTLDSYATNDAVYFDNLKTFNFCRTAQGMHDSWCNYVRTPKDYYTANEISNKETAFRNFIMSDKE